MKEKVCGVIHRERENSEMKHSCAWERVKVVKLKSGGGGALAASIVGLCWKLARKGNLNVE
ncbi:unnamed protein product [Sphenostylis stenocarpa]|uniref:Uncharacterized protein n=1 Tax=Sphenostylis stenocarpa TaxID=92480 RepID=A0AA86VFJ1_9FABA|nr:unnamed protein product [Sphenostylis stenocarpa]